MAFKETSNTFSNIAVTSRLEKVNSFLKELDSIIDFEKLRPTLNKNGIAKSNVAGAPAYDNVIMFRILLLQKYYNLSDQATQDALYVNLLFIRFVGLSLEDDVPDESTIGRFRNSLLKAKLYDKLFNSINKQLENKNLIAKTGKSILVDATLIKSDNTQIKNKSKETYKEDKESIKTINEELDKKLDEELESKSPSKKKIKKILNAKEHNSKTYKNSQLDELQNIDTKDITTSQAIIENEEDSYDHKYRIDSEIRIGYHASKKQYTQGYKAHIAVDEASGVMIDKQMTFANTSDIDTVEAFVENSKGIEALYADKAYKSKEVDELLKTKNIENMICLKEKQTLSKEEIKQQRKDERPKHKIRAKVEHRFAEIKVQMKQATTRYVGLVRNNMNFTLVCIAANLKLLAHKKMRGTLKLIQ
jgi:transposase, IS5 family